MKLIVAVDNNWAIGHKNQLLVRIPEDQKWFRTTTTGKVVVMGRKTLESFPNGQPLKNRVNIVLTRDADYKVKDAIVVHSVDELKAELANYNSDDVFVIGGESIYKLLLNDCDTAYVTKIDYNYEADTYFPNLDKLDNWVMTEEGDEQTYFDILYSFTKYEKK